MFVTSSDDRSVGSTDGDLDSKRNKLVKLYHAAYCLNEGYTPATHCKVDPHCCATKRLFEHMMSCADTNCEVPCCRVCRRIWRHYRKCRHVKNCPLCCAVGHSYSSDRLAPRFQMANGSSDGSSSVIAPLATTAAAAAASGVSSLSSAVSTLSLSSTDNIYYNGSSPTAAMPVRQHSESTTATSTGKENSAQRIVTTPPGTFSLPPSRGQSHDDKPRTHYGWMSKSSAVPTTSNKTKTPAEPVPTNTTTATTKTESSSSSPAATAVAAAPIPQQQQSRRPPHRQKSTEVPKKSTSAKPPLSPRRPPIWALF